MCNILRNCLVLVSHCFVPNCIPSFSTVTCNQPNKCFKELFFNTVVVLQVGPTQYKQPKQFGALCFSVLINHVFFSLHISSWIFPLIYGLIEQVGKNLESLSEFPSDPCHTKLNQGRSQGLWWLGFPIKE